MQPKFTPTFAWEPAFDELSKLPVLDSEGYHKHLQASRESFRFIQITLKRLESSGSIAHSFRETLDNFMKEGPKSNIQNESAPIPPQIGLVFDLYNRTLEEITLDYQNFFLHARILMDRLCRLTKFLFPKDNLPFRSFHNHRNYFLERPIFQNQLKSYSEYIKQNTSWFALLLQVTRDYLIVHSKPFLFTAISSGGTELPRQVKINLRTSTVNEYFPRLNEIKSHYPENESLQHENNFWEIIKILSNMPLRKDDEHLLTQIIGSVGTTFPRLDSICFGILTYSEVLSVAARATIKIQKGNSSQKESA